MKTNNFYGPFQLSDFDKNGKIKEGARNLYPVKPENNESENIPQLSLPGIYIWGNLFDIDTNGKILYPTDCSLPNFKFDPKLHRFIPYYVGRHKKSLLKRLNEHRNIRVGDATKYIRFSFEYWKEFFKDPAFPINRGKSTVNAIDLVNLTTLRSNSVIYHNNINVLSSIYPQLQIVQVGSNHPIINQSLYGSQIYDTLDLVINGGDNFWFCYCPVYSPESKTLNKIETFTFYSLKGKTISKTGICPRASIKPIIFDKTNGVNIFKKIGLNNGGELVFPSDCFNGY